MTVSFTPTHLSITILHENEKSRGFLLDIYCVAFMLVAAKAKERLCMRESFKRVPSNSQLEGHVSGSLVSLRERSAIPSLYDHYMVTIRSLTIRSLTIRSLATTSY